MSACADRPDDEVCIRRGEKERRGEERGDVDRPGEKGAVWYVRIDWKERGEGVEEREGTGERCLEDERGHEQRDEYRVGSDRCLRFSNREKKWICIFT